jgi:hypothetical protein
MEDRFVPTILQKLGDAATFAFPPHTRRDAVAPSIAGKVHAVIRHAPGRQRRTPVPRLAPLQTCP